MNWVGGVALGIIAVIVMWLWESQSLPKRIVGAVIGTIAGIVTLMVLADDMEGKSRLDRALTLLVLACLYLYYRVEKLTKSVKAIQDDVAKLKR